jgi:hypothetical protein
LQIEIKLKKRDGLRWTTLERDPTTSEVAQSMPEGRLKHVFKNKMCWKFVSFWE